MVDIVCFCLFGGLVPLRQYSSSQFCGVAEATGLGFVFVVINPRVLSANRVDFGLVCFMNILHFHPSSRQTCARKRFRPTGVLLASRSCQPTRNSSRYGGGGGICLTTLCTQAFHTLGTMGMTLEGSGSMVTFAVEM